MEEMKDWKKKPFGKTERKSLLEARKLPDIVKTDYPYVTFKNKTATVMKKLYANFELLYLNPSFKVDCQ